jgi:glycosyltransferase involved in cell wall biosynthesis
MPVDTEVFTPRTVHRQGLLFVGRLDPQKGLEVLLSALARLPNDVSLTVVGDGAEAQRLRARAAALGVAGRVRWVGAEPQAALADYYRNARLVVAPATAPEGLGLVPIEALLCETPVVASNVGGLPDVVDDGQTGRLVAPSDPALLANTIAEVLANPERLEQWGRAGRTRVLDRFTPKACASAYRAVYEDAIRARV